MAAILISGCSAGAQNKPGASKILVAYFSWSGNNKAVAEQIAGQIGADLFEIKTAVPYPIDYDECVEVAGEEKRSNARPELVGRVENMEQYDTLIMCYPNWWNTMPMALFTFFESYDFSKKTIYPFMSHGGNRYGTSFADIKSIAPGITIGEAFSISAWDKDATNGPMIKTPNREIANWLRKIGILK